MKESVVGSQMGSLMALLPGLKDGQSKRLCGYNRRQRRYLAGELARLPVPVSAIRANLANFLNAPDWFFGRGGNWMDKIAALKEILALDPNNSFARYGLAMERVGRGETDEALSEFDDPRHSDFVEFVLPVLATMSLSELVAATGLHASTLKRIRAGTARPHTENQDALWVVAIEHARAELTRRGLRLPETHLAALRLYIEAMSAQPRQCPVCGEPMAGRRQRYCTNRCRQRAVRARSRAN